MRRAVTFSILALLATSSTQARDDRSHARKVDAGAVSFSIVDRGDGTHWWRRTNKEFRIETVQAEASGDLLHYLFLSERVVDSHIGIEGGNSRLKVTAHLLTEKQVGKPLWTFEVDGDEWRLVGSRIEVTKYGCCDAPDRRFYFQVSDGRPIKR